MTRAKSGSMDALSMVNPQAAAIAIGSTMHMAAIRALFPCPSVICPSSPQEKGLSQFDPAARERVSWTDARKVGAKRALKPRQRKRSRAMICRMTSLAPPAIREMRAST